MDQVVVRVEKDLAGQVQVPIAVETDLKAGGEAKASAAREVPKVARVAVLVDQKVDLVAEAREGPADQVAPAVLILSEC